MGSLAFEFSDAVVKGALRDDPLKLGLADSLGLVTQDLAPEGLFGLRQGLILPFFNDGDVEYLVMPIGLVGETIKLSNDPRR